MVWGMFPHFFKGISWEGHMLGSIAGVMFAVIYINEGPVYKEPEWFDDDDTETSGENVLDESGLDEDVINHDEEQRSL